MTGRTNRREVLCFAGAASAFGAAIATGGAALATGGVIPPATPFAIAEAKYRAGRARFASLPDDMEVTDPESYDREIDQLGDLCRAVDDAPVADLREFALAFLAAHDDGNSSPWAGTVRKLAADAKRLTGAA